MALNAEITHALLRAMLGLWGGENQQVPEPLRIVRPGEKPVAPKRVATFGDMARRLVGK